MSPKIVNGCAGSSETPNLAWLDPALMPMVLPPHLPLVATSTARALPRLGRQQPIVVLSVVVGIGGPARQVAVRKGTLPSLAEINCHGGTHRSEALEMS